MEFSNGMERSEKKRINKANVINKEEKWREKKGKNDGRNRNRRRNLK